MPVSPLTTSAARATRSHRSPRSVRPARTRSSGKPRRAGDRLGQVPLGRGAGDQHRRVRIVERCGDGREPVHRPALRPERRPGVHQDRAGPPVRPPRSGGRRRRSSGSAGIPRPAGARTIGPARAGGPRRPRPTPGPPARARLRTAEPDAPRRFEGVERAVALRAGAVQVHGDVRGGAGPRHRDRVGRRAGVGTRASTPPIRSTSGASAAVVASTSRCSGWARRSARRAGTATSRSPICNARSTRRVGRRSSATRHPYPP